MKDEKVIGIIDWFILEVKKSVKRGETELSEGASLIGRLMNPRNRAVELAGLSKANEDEYALDFSPTDHPRGFMRSGAYKN
jgi:hypothetical protein